MLSSNSHQSSKTKKDRQCVVKCHNVGMRYDVGPEVLNGITFSLREGDFVFLIGESGAGKSSLMRLLYLAHKPNRGHIHLFGDDMSDVSHYDLPSIRRKIGVVLQDFDLLNHMTAFDNVALPLRVRGIDESTVVSHVKELMGWVGLGKVMDVCPALLSGGQKQRVAIARAVIGRPRLLIADEPTGSVDDSLAKRLLYLFEELNKTGTTILIATHSRYLLQEFPYPVLALKDGQFVNPHDVLRSEREKSL